MSTLRETPFSDCRKSSKKKRKSRATYTYAVKHLRAMSSTVNGDAQLDEHVKSEQQQHDEAAAAAAAAAAVAAAAAAAPDGEGDLHRGEGERPDF